MNRFTGPDSREKDLKKDQRIEKKVPNVYYIYTAVNINLDELFSHLFTFTYISSAGWFQRSWVYVCRNFHTPRWASRFSAFSPAHSAIYFFTHKSCGL